jgi:S1-C subfamily serine protease
MPDRHLPCFIEINGAGKEGLVMKEGPISSFGNSILAHAVTVLVTLTLVMVLFGDRLGGRRRPPLVQIPAVSSQPAPAPLPPQPVSPTFVASQRQDADNQVPGPPTDVLKDLDPDERNNVQVYAAANKSVVNITTEAEVSGFFGDETSTGTGSGFVIDKQGHVLTNFHVVQGANSVRVRLFDGSAQEGQVIGFDASNDVAVLLIRVPADKLFPLTFGDSSKVMVGQKILALGNPFGLERTLTSGIISSLERSLKAKNGRTIKGIIQTDAAINPGNSGGPLLNSKGQVIGMNTAIISNVGQSAGISFAVPINPIARILRQLIENGRVIRGDLGIARVYATGEGLLVVSVVDRGPAERAGIQPAKMRIEQIAPGLVRKSLDPDSADLIVAIEHKRVRTVEELLTEVEKHRPGEAIRVTVVRDGQPMDIRVQLGES